MKMMKTSILLSVLLLSAFVSARPSTDTNDEEYFDFATFDTHDEHESEPTDYVEITQAPKKDIYYPQESIQAECKVTGMPIPIVEWVQGTEMRNDHDFDTNSIIEMSPTGIATVVARLIIHPHHIKPGTTKTFTCVGRSGAKVVKSSTTVHFSHESKHPRLAGDEMFTSMVGAEKTRIYEYVENIFENQGTNVLLPCKASAKASIFWINDNGKQITGKEPRFKILPTGDLMITSLQFKDMGTYICLAKNAVSKDVVSTFVYPMAVKQQKK